eukprot:2073368-Rhodomonas_salina.1
MDPTSCLKMIISLPFSVQFANCAIPRVPRYPVPGYPATGRSEGDLQDSTNLRKVPWVPTRGTPGTRVQRTPPKEPRGVPDDFT